MRISDNRFFKSSSFAFLFLLTFISMPTLADLDGEKGVYLVDKSNQEQRVASIVLTPKGKGYLYSLHLDTEYFEDQFLSMRPFKCLMGGEQVLCYVDYPYTNQKYIEEGDLTSLEYDLLFLHKSPTEYGINLWNGIYYKLQLADGEIKGKLYELDMNLLSAPPEEGITRPITDDDIFEGDIDNQRFPELLIK